jgi:hypothetical protein
MSVSTGNSADATAIRPFTITVTPEAEIEALRAERPRAGPTRRPSRIIPKNVSIPVAVSVFPGELYQAPRTWAERAYRNFIYYNEVDRGGHFAAWEQPQLVSEEVRARRSGRCAELTARSSELSRRSSRCLRLATGQRLGGYFLEELADGALE